MYSLYLDTATKYLSIGIAKDYRLIDKVQYEANKRQSEVTIPELKKQLDKLNLSLSDIGEIVITIGPGSFTGIRISLCIAKVIASLKKIPLKTISTLNAYAQESKKIVLIDAKVNRAYIGIYENNKPLIDEQVLTLSEIKEIIKNYPEFEIVNDSYLLGYESKPIDIVENINRLAPNLKVEENVDNLVPLYFKDR